MSSNMYGFTCNIDWNERNYEVQITYVGTFGDSQESLDYATDKWETLDPIRLAQYDLKIVIGIKNGMPRKDYVYKIFGVAGLMKIQEIIFLFHPSHPIKR